MTQKTIRKAPAAESAPKPELHQTEPTGPLPGTLIPVTVKHGVFTPHDGSPARVMLEFPDNPIQVFTMEPAFARQIAALLIEDAAVAEKRLLPS